VLELTFLSSWRFASDHLNKAVYVLVNDGDDANEMTGCSLEDDGDYLSFYYHEHYPT
jgi:hypothetical protein